MPHPVPPFDHQDRQTGRVIAFPSDTTRRARPLAEGEGRGEILLFLGVRYERLPDAPALPRRARS